MQKFYNREEILRNWAKFIYLFISRKSEGALVKEFTQILEVELDIKFILKIFDKQDYLFLANSGS